MKTRFVCFHILHANHLSISQLKTKICLFSHFSCRSPEHFETSFFLFIFLMFQDQRLFACILKLLFFFFLMFQDQRLFACIFSNIIMSQLFCFQPKNGQKGCLMVLAILRLAFLPLFMMCNIHPGNRKYFPVILDSDWWPAVLTLGLGLTNGYIGTLSMLYAPT